jgi:hypothetical protein
MKLNHSYLITFDFSRKRSKFYLADEFNYEYAVEYFEECSFVKDKLWQLFPNKIIEISISSFLIKTKLNSEELKFKLILETTDFSIKANDNVNRQIFIAQIKDIHSFAQQNKLSEIEYIANAQV